MLRVKGNEIEIEIYKLSKITTTWILRKCGETKEYVCKADLLLGNGVNASLYLEKEEYEELEKIIRGEKTNCILNLRFKEIYIH